MPPIQYSLVSNDDSRVITVFTPAGAPLIAGSDHPNFDAIVSKLVCQELDLGAPVAIDEVVELFDIPTAISQRFEELSERVEVKDGRVYFDGDEVHSSLTNAILRFLDEGVDDWQPLVEFFENVMLNPCEHSREQLYDWLSVREGITLTFDGFIVGYKGVHVRREDGALVSGYMGKAKVNGEEVVGNIPNEVGSVITMPRSEVQHDPSAACSSGLYVGTFSYAQRFARGAILRVHVNPRDVVSVPNDAGGEKIRVCRYSVVEVIQQPLQDALAFDDDYIDEDYGEFDEDYGEFDE